MDFWVEDLHRETLMTKMLPEGEICVVVISNYVIYEVYN